VIKNYQFILKLSIIAGISLVFVRIFNWTITLLIGLILDKLLEYLTLIALLIAIGLSVAFLIKNYRVGNTNKFLPLSVAILFFLMACILPIPWDTVSLKMECFINNPRREKVVNMVRNNELKPNVSYNKSLIQLPKKYAYLSQGGGEIIVERSKTDNTLNVFFYSFRGVLDNFSGYIYTASSIRPDKHIFDGDFKQIIKVSDHCYWGSSY
jgi:hypothetical protein